MLMQANAGGAASAAAPDPSYQTYFHASAKKTTAATTNTVNCNGKLLAKPPFLPVGALMIDHLLAFLGLLGAASLLLVIIGREIR